MVVALAPQVDEQWRIPDALWEWIVPLLPLEPPHPKGGRPFLPARPCMDAIFYVLRTGCQWKALPRTFGAASTVHDRFQQWRDAGVFERLWHAGLVVYDQTQGVDWTWQAMDGAMTKAPLGGSGDGAQPDGPREAGHEAQPPHRRPGHPPRRRGGRGQPARHEAGRGDPAGIARGAAFPHRGGTATPLSGQGVRLR